jgi:cation transport protein ChaC
MAGRLVWFFGYGSLMWDPGFAPDASVPARLDGWHRALCIVSRVYRGTPGSPGLVLGLAPGGVCVGRALGVRPVREAEVLDYLDAREQVGGVYVYERVVLSVRLLAEDRDVDAWCYVARSGHPDCALGLAPAEIATRVARSRGRAGSNADYVRNTVAHLRDIGITEPELEAIAASLGEPGQE